MMGKLQRAALVACFVFQALATQAGTLTIQYRTGATNLVLNSSDARQQLLAVRADETDVTRKVTWSAES